MSKLLLDSSDCEILLLLKIHGTLSAMQMATGLDKGYLSRKLSKIAGESPVLIRVQGKWQLTSQGHKMVEWYEEAVQNQKLILMGKDELTFGTTQTISERKLTGILPALVRETGFKYFNVLTEFGNCESAILSGKIDFAFVCSIPQSPEIRYKRITKWPYVVIIPYSWTDTFKNVSELLQRPYISHTGIDMRLLLGVEYEIPAPVVRFDHLAGVRKAVVSGLGWAVLPYYAVEEEIEGRKMKLLKKQLQLGQVEDFQLWWVPGSEEKKVIQRIVQVMGEIL